MQTHTLTAGVSVIGALLVAALSAGTPANALEDRKIYSGAECLPATETQRFNRKQGRITNSSATKRGRFSCPLVREIEYGDLATASVVLFGAERSKCRLFSRSQTGELVAAVEPGKTVELAPGVRRLEFSPGPDNIADAKGGYYYLWCIIAGGGKSGIVSYGATETKPLR